MTAEQMTALLRTTGLPAAYDHFREPTPLPHVVWREGRSNHFAADGVVYHKIRRIIVELYTERKEPQTEALVETALSRFVWSRDETYIQTENCYLITYEFEV